MFAPHCPQHGHRVLLDPDEYDFRNTADGIEVHWRCPCGQRGVTRTGARASRPTSTACA